MFFYLFFNTYLILQKLQIQKRRPYGRLREFNLLLHISLDYSEHE